MTNPEEMTSEEKMEWAQEFAKENFYNEPVMYDRQGLTFFVINRRMFNTQILKCEIGDENAIHDYWCYSNPVEAAMALLSWTGEGDPPGWFRHPPTGRRVSRDPDERDQDGVRVGEVGKLYYRR